MLLSAHDWTGGGRQLCGGASQPAAPRGCRAREGPSPPLPPLLPLLLLAVVGYHTRSGEGKGGGTSCSTARMGRRRRRRSWRGGSRLLWPWNALCCGLMMLMGSRRRRGRWGGERGGRGRGEAGWPPSPFPGELQLMAAQPAWTPPPPPDPTPLSPQQLESAAVRGQRPSQQASPAPCAPTASAWTTRPSAAAAVAARRAAATATAQLPSSSIPSSLP
ncbi:hypothetical protein V8C86DRAFT_2943981 [Haematococcus lacustris]